MNPFDQKFFDSYFGRRSLGDELMNPVKNYHIRTDNTAEVIRGGEGTKEKPYEIEKSFWVTKKFHGWREDDGSYHEIPVDEGSMKWKDVESEVTENYGGTK